MSQIIDDKRRKMTIPVPLDSGNFLAEDGSHRISIGRTFNTGRAIRKHDKGDEGKTH